MENGQIGSDEFCRKLREHTGKNLSFEDIKWAWMGFIVNVPQYKLDFISELRKTYKVYLLSNTNPIVQSWARSDKFTTAGYPISYYFDKMYTSYEVGITKPSPAIFEFMIKDTGMNVSETLFVDDGSSNIAVAQRMNFHTLQPENGEDWRNAICAILR